MSVIQQRSKTGQLTIGGTQKVNFQLPHFLDRLGHPDPGNYTLQFGLEDPNNPSVASAITQPRAEIYWVVGGNQVRRVVDVNNGISISGVAEGVSVSIYDDSVIGGPGTRDPYTVNMQVAKGSRPSVQQPPTYSLREQISAGGGAVENISFPKNIGAISVYVAVAPFFAGAAIGAYDIEVIQTVSGAFIKHYDPRQSDWVPLGASADGIQLKTSAACPPFYYQVTVGIDG